MLEIYKINARLKKEWEKQLLEDMGITEKELQKIVCKIIDDSIGKALIIASKYSKV